MEGCLEMDGFLEVDEGGWSMDDMQPCFDAGVRGA